MITIDCTSKDIPEGKSKTVLIVRDKDIFMKISKITSAGKLKIEMKDGSIHFFIDYSCKYILKNNYEIYAVVSKEEEEGTYSFYIKSKGEQKFSAVLTAHTKFYDGGYKFEVDLTESQFKEIIKNLK